MVLFGALYAITAVPPMLARDDTIRTYQTAVSEHRNIVLVDGSEISMGAKSSLSVNFSTDKRIVVLESGEALFVVAHDAERPLCCHSGSKHDHSCRDRIQCATGKETGVVVTVTEGTVEVKRTPQGSRPPSDGDQDPVQRIMTTTVSAGVQAVVSPTELSLVEVSNPNAVTEWRIGHLQYRSEPLKFVVADVSRYTTREIIIADSEVEAMIFTGSVFQDQTDDWLEALETAFPVEGYRRGRQQDSDPETLSLPVPGLAQEYCRACVFPQNRSRVVLMGE